MWCFEVLWKVCFRAFVNGGVDEYLQLAHHTIHFCVAMFLRYHSSPLAAVWDPRMNR